MNEIVLFIGVMIGSGTCTVTSYQSVKGQTDSSPHFTSIGDHTHKGGVAASRDLLKRWGGPLDYGDYVYIENLGIYKINDCMGESECVSWKNKKCTKRIPITRHFDVWVSSRKEEHQIGVQRQKVYVFTRSIK